MAIGSVLGNLGTKVGDFFKNNATSIASGASSLFSSLFSNATTGKQQRRAYEYARQLQQQQYDLSIRGFKDAPSAQREGLVSAGYNPMLALGKIGDGVSVAGGTPVNANATDTSGIKDAISGAVQLQNQTNQTKASTDALYASADKSKAEKAAIVERLPYISKQAKADYMKTSMESAKLENDIHYQNEFLNYLQNSLEVQQRLAEMGFANSKDIAKINAGATRYSADKAYNATTQSASMNVKSKPFGFGSWYLGKMLDSVNSKGEFIEDYLRRFYN